MTVNSELLMKIVNKAREIPAFSTKQIDNIVMEKIDGTYYMKCTFDNGKGQLEIVLHEDVFKNLFKLAIKEKVEWLLKEIEKLDMIELEEFSGERFDNLHDPDEVITHTIDYFKHLIKQAFHDVLQGDEE